MLSLCSVLPTPTRRRSPLVGPCALFMIDSNFFYVFGIRIPSYYRITLVRAASRAALRYSFHRSHSNRSMAHANLPLRSYHGTRNGCSRREGGKGSWHRELSLSRFVVWTRGEPSGRAARATCCTVGCARASSQRFTPSLRLGLPIFASRARSPAWTMSDAVKSGPGCSSVIHCANSASAPVCNVTAGGLVVGATVEAVEAVGCGMAGRSIANASFVSEAQLRCTGGDVIHPLLDL